MAEFIDPNNPPSHEQWRARYDRDMQEAAELYRDVTDALARLEVPAEVTQTGGMCLAVTWPTRGGYWLLTDTEGPLPWNREHVEGWALGRYDDEDQLIGDTFDVSDPSVPAAVELVLSAIRPGECRRGFPNDTGVTTMPA